MSEQTGEIVLILNSTEKHFQYADFNLTFESTDKEVLDALSPRVLEEEGFNLNASIDDQEYTIKRQEDSKMCFIYPKSTAGSS